MSTKEYRLMIEGFKWLVQELDPSGEWITVGKFFNEEKAREKIQELIEQQIKDSIQIDMIDTR